MIRILTILLIIICFNTEAAYSYLYNNPQDTVKTVKDSISVTLDEITVRGNKKLVEQNGAVSTIRVVGSPFENIGTVYDMLSNLPGLRKTPDGIEVQGLGKPVIYVDGREIRRDSELQTLYSSDIKDVKIDRAPDIGFASSAQVVIFITTRKSPNDYLNLDISNTLGIRRKTSEYPAVSAKVKLNKLTSSLTYTYGTSGALIKETYFRDVYNNSNSFRLQPRENPIRNFSHTINWSGDYVFNSNHKIGIYYYLNKTDSRNRKTGINEFSENGFLSTTDFSQRAKSDKTLNSVSALYTYSKGRNYLTISQDIAFTNSDIDTDVTEKHHTRTTKNKSCYRIYTTNIRVGTSLPGKIGAAFGIRYDHTDTKSKISYPDVPIVGIYASNTSTREDNPQPYAALARRFGFLTANIGLRYEYMHRKISNVSDKKNNTLSYNKNNLFPWVNLSAVPKKGLNLSFQYNRSSVNPNFNRLNSGSVFIDSLTYMVSNPELRSSITDAFSFYATYKGIGINIRHSFTRHPIGNVEIPLNNNTAIINRLSVNLPRMDETKVSFSYTTSLSGINIYAESSLGFPDIKYNYNGIAVRHNRMSVDAQLNCSYRLNNNFSFYGNYTLQGRRHYIISEQRSVQNLNVGINGSFIKKKLSVNFEFMDILHKAHYNNIWSTYGTVRWGTMGTNDMRGIRLRISYTIFNKTINVAMKRNNENILNRIE